MILRGKVSAITGGGNGIGRAAAELFAREGAKVAILEIDEVAGRKAESSILSRGGVAKFIPVDVADSASTDAAFAAIANLFGVLHILYNNASILDAVNDAAIHQCSPATWARTLAVNLGGTYHCSRAAVPLLSAAGGGSIINTASNAALVGIPGCDAYTASKGAIVALTRSMAVEYGARRIRVNGIAPGAVATRMLRSSGRAHDRVDTRAFLQAMPTGRLGTPMEVAQLALFLASDAASYVTGTIIAADGGITATSQTIAFASQTERVVSPS